MTLTTGKRAPQMRMSEKERMRPILAEMFSCLATWAVSNSRLVKSPTYVSACVKTLGTIAGVEEESLIPLHLGELVAKTLDFGRRH
jgi:hypothetical protein